MEATIIAAIARLCSTSFRWSGAVCGRDSRQATRSRLGLPSSSVRKIDQSLNLGDGKRGKTLAEFLDAFSEIVTVHNCVRQNAGSTYDGLSRHLARNLFDQLAGHPVNVRFRACHACHPSLNCTVDFIVGALATQAAQALQRTPQNLPLVKRDRATASTLSPVAHSSSCLPRSPARRSPGRSAYPRKADWADRTSPGRAPSPGRTPPRRPTSPPSTCHDRRSACARPGVK